jgi:dTDP-4-amino-4,6-dideoxygalactose transaminase
MASIPNQEVTVPFVSLAPSHTPLREELLEDFGELIDTGAFINGPAVREFEDAFARYTHRAQCVGVASGLDALRLGLLALDIGPGDEVIVPAGTFVATLEAVSQAGATPVPVDIGEDDYCLDPAAAAAAVTERTAAVMPVHLYGQVADMRRLTDLPVQIVEDACQAHGASRDGVAAGEAGVAAAFSFYPGKNLGAFGDAGALVVDDSALATRVSALREHGQPAKYRHAEVGYTARLDTIQALALLRKLPLLDGWNDERRAVANRYLEGLSGVGDLTLPPVAENSQPVWHLFVIRTADPEALALHLRERGVATGRHYPEPVHLTDAYAHLGYGAGSFPVAEQLARECLSLPIFPGMTDAQVARVVESVGAFFDGR